MGLRIIYGRSGTGKSEYCYKEIVQKIKTENKILIITPEQFSFTAEKKLMEAIDTEAVLNAEVVTLSRMAYRIINEIGGKIETNLSKCGKAMLIYSILNNNKKCLKLESIGNAARRYAEKSPSGGAPHKREGISFAMITHRKYLLSGKEVDIRQTHLRCTAALLHKSEQAGTDGSSEP